MSWPKTPTTHDQAIDATFSNLPRIEMDDEVTLQDRLRKIASHGVSVWGDLQTEAAEYIDKLEAEGAAFAMRKAIELHKLETQVAALTKDAERMRWLDKNTTFFNVDHTEPVRGANIPTLSSVSTRIWYHATDDTDSSPLSAVVDAAIAASKEKA